MRLNYVINRFALISALQGEELSKWLPLCKDAMDEIASLAEDYGEDELKIRKLSNLAGVLAYYKYCLYSACEEKSVTVGAVSIQQGDITAEYARRLFEKEKEALSDLLKTQGNFSFKRVTI